MSKLGEAGTVASDVATSLPGFPPEVASGISAAGRTRAYEVLGSREGVRGAIWESRKIHGQLKYKTV